jgi:hypothetical protein
MFRTQWLAVTVFALVLSLTTVRVDAQTPGNESQSSEGERRQADLDRMKIQYAERRQGDVFGKRAGQYKLCVEGWVGV